MDTRIENNEWGDAQNSYHRREIKDVKYYIIRWKQGLVTALLDYATTQWKERCDFLHAENLATKDQRFRTMLKLKLEYLKANKSTIHQSDYFLLAKSDSFFKKCDTANLEMWFLRVKIAVERQEQRMKQQVGDIRKYTVMKRRKRKRTRMTTVQLPPKQYTQLTIFDQPQVQQQVPLPSQDDIIQSEQRNINKRRKRLENLVRKRRLHQRSILYHMKRIKRRKCHSTVSTIQPTHTIPHDNNRVPKRKRQNGVRVGSVRQRLRKYGRDLKNDR